MESSTEQEQNVSLILHLPPMSTETTDEQSNAIREQRLIFGNVTTSEQVPVKLGKDGIIIPHMHNLEVIERS